MGRENRRLYVVGRRGGERRGRVSRNFQVEEGESEIYDPPEFRVRV